MIKNKAKVKDTSENANRKQGPDFNIGQKRIQGLKHTG